MAGTFLQISIKTRKSGRLKVDGSLGWLRETAGRGAGRPIEPGAAPAP